MFVGVLLGVGVRDGVLVGVGVLLGVLVGVGVEVGVLDGVGVGPTQTEPLDGELSVVSVVVSITSESM